MLLIIIWSVAATCGLVSVLIVDDRRGVGKSGEVHADAAAVVTRVHPSLR